MLPVPFADYIPEHMKTDDNASGVDLCTFLDSQISAWDDNTLSLGTLINPLQCRAEVLNELAYMFGVDYNITTTRIFYLIDELNNNLVDESGNVFTEVVLYSVAQRENPITRIKTGKAINSYKNWDLFDDHIKSIIDIISGFSASLFNGLYLVDELGDYFIDANGNYLTDLPMAYLYFHINIGDGGILTPETVNLITLSLTRDCNLAYIQINYGYVISNVFYSYGII